MSESSTSPAHDALTSLTELGAELTAAAALDPEVAVDHELLHRAERAIAVGIAMLVTTRDEAAVALEASVGGAIPRNEPALARDLQLVVDILRQALERALA